MGRGVIDILGEATPRLRGKPKKEEATFEDGDDKFDERDTMPVLRGVSVSWLSQAFRMDRITVKKKLATLHPVRMERGNIGLFDFVQAAGRLVKPQVDIHEYIKSMRPEDMPTDLQKEYWDALLKKQKYMRQAGELWHTNDVIEVFSDAFKHIKTSSQLWVNQLDRTTGLTPEQLTTLGGLIDQLLDDIHKRLTAMQEMKVTPSSVESEGDDDVSEP